MNNIGHNILIVLYFTLILAFQASSISLGATAEQARINTLKTEKHEVSLAISVETVAGMLKERKNLTLVDVRNPGEFMKVRIPGSINVPLYAIKTKPFLKAGLTVLVNEGYQHSSLESECRRLKENNFNIRILDGGLNAWKGKGLKLSGDPFAQRELNRISPAMFYREKVYKTRIVLDVSESKGTNSKYVPPGTIHFALSRGTLSSLSKKDIRTLRSLCRCGNTRCPPGYRRMPFTTVLVLNEDGLGYDEIESILKQSGVENVFFLKGGLRAYRKYLDNLLLSRKPRAERIKTIRKCRNCVKAAVSSTD